MMGLPMYFTTEEWDFQEYDMKAFNLAMVGKQVWKSISKSDALITQRLKAKYFPLGDHFSAGLGHNPSYVWRGLLRAKDVLRRGFNGMWGWLILSLITLQPLESSKPIRLNMFCMMLQQFY